MNLNCHSLRFAIDLVIKVVDTEVVEVAWEPPPSR